MIRDYQSGDYEELCLLEYNDVQSVERQPTFRRNVTSIFRVEEYAKQETSKKQVASSAWLILRS
jgi:hypothetical protein